MKKGKLVLLISVVIILTALIICGYYFLNKKKTIWCYFGKHNTYIIWIDCGL